MSYPYKFENKAVETVKTEDDKTVVSFKHVKGAIPSEGASSLRTMMQEARNDESKIVAICPSYDGLSSRQAEEAGFPALFLSGYSVAASMGLSDTGYIAFEDVVQRIQEISRVTNAPMIADGDTGYGGLASVYRTVQGFAEAGAAGIMIEDQKWPKKCGHTKGKEVVDREEACARIRAAVAAREEGKDIFILARTDALIVSWEEAMERAREFTRLGADAIFMEAMKDRESMGNAVKEIDNAVFANIIEGGKTENVSADDMAKLGIAACTYPLTLLTSRIHSNREALTNLKKSFSTGSPPMILSFEDVCHQVGFDEFWKRETSYLGK